MSLQKYSHTVLTRRHCKVVSVSQVNMQACRHKTGHIQPPKPAPPFGDVAMPKLFLNMHWEVSQDCQQTQASCYKHPSCQPTSRSNMTSCAHAALLAAVPLAGCVLCCAVPTLHCTTFAVLFHGLLCYDVWTKQQTGWADPHLPLLCCAVSLRHHCCRQPRTAVLCRP